MAKEQNYPTQAERSILRALAQYGTLAKAAASLYLSRHAVKSSLTRMRTRYRLVNTPQLMAMAGREGWLDGHIAGN